MIDWKECAACGNGYEPTSSRQRVCFTCTPNKGWQARYRRYGITKPEYDDLYEKQDGKCPLCRCHLLHDIDTCIDHDHDTGEIRGILCRMCNMVVSKFEDDDYADRVFKYLKGGFHCV